MSTLTVRLPDDKHSRLKLLAKQRGISLNRLMDELATMALTEFDAFTRFEIRAAKGSAARGIELLNKLDAEDGSQEQSS